MAMGTQGIIVKNKQKQQISFMMLNFTISIYI